MLRRGLSLAGGGVSGTVFPPEAHVPLCRVVSETGDQDHLGTRAGGQEGGRGLPELRVGVSLVPGPPAPPAPCAHRPLCLLEGSLLFCPPGDFLLKPTGTCLRSPEAVLMPLSACAASVPPGTPLLFGGERTERGSAPWLQRSPGAGHSAGLHTGGVGG